MNSVFGYNDLLLHLCLSSTLVNHGPWFFIILPLAIAVFLCHTKEWVQDAVGFLLRGLSSLMYTLRHWERVFSRGKSLTSKRLCNRKPPCKRGAARKEGFTDLTTFPWPSLVQLTYATWRTSSWEISSLNPQNEGLWQSWIKTWQKYLNIYGNTSPSLTCSGPWKQILHTGVLNPLSV